MLRNEKPISKTNFQDSEINYFNVHINKLELFTKYFAFYKTIFHLYFNQSVVSLSIDQYQLDIATQYNTRQPWPMSLSRLTQQNCISHLANTIYF